MNVNNCSVNYSNTDNCSISISNTISKQINTSNLINSTTNSISISNNAINSINPDLPVPKARKSFNCNNGNTLNSSNSTLTILHHNVQSLSNKTNYIETLLLTEWKEVNALCLTEHWLQSDKLQLTLFPSFRLASYYCRTDWECGGSCIYIRDNIEFVTGHDTNNLSIDKSFELSYVTLPKLSSVIVCLYRTTDGNFTIFLENLEIFLNSIFQPNLSLIICGDLNIDFLVDSKPKTDFLNLLANFNLKPTVSSPTRVTLNSKTSLDQIIINDKFPNTTRIINTGFSDHYAQIAMIDIGLNTTNCNKFISCRNFCEENVETMNFLLNNETWTDTYDADNINTKFKAFMDTFSHYFNIAFPIQTKKQNLKSHMKSWLTQGILISCKQKRRLHDISKYCKSQEFLNYFKTYKHILNKVINQAKKTRNNDYIATCKNKSKAIWNVVKNETGTNIAPIKNIQLTVNQTVYSNPLSNANLFNTYFTEIADTLLKNIRPCTPSKGIVKTVNSIFLKEVDYAEVWDIIQHLKNSYSTGIDDVPNTILKKCARFIIDPLTHIFNNSFLTGIFPDQLKIAKIIPLHKKGSKDNMENYRPISLLTGFSKILEKLMFNRLVSFVGINNILTNSQHGFRKNRSTNTATYDFTNYILNAIDQKYSVAGIVLDLSKAFDLISHKLLLSKLEMYGIRGIAHKWIESYLANRKQAVEVKHYDESTNSVKSYLSSFKHIMHGVPQGSILGPFLFLLYINDIADYAKDHKMVLFADDTSVLFKGKDDSALQSDIDQTLSDLSSWFSCNRIVVNTNKTVSLNFHTIQNKEHFKSEMFLMDSRINTVYETKFLGLWIQDNLKWTTHIHNLAKRLNKSSYAIRILSNSTSLEIVTTAYFAYFHSILKYGIIFWGNATGSNFVFLIQKRTIRAMLGAKKMESCKPLFKKLNILPLPCMYIYDVLLYVKSNIENIDLLQRNQSIHLHKTRQRENLHITATSTSLCKNGVFHSGINLYNKLPSKIKEINQLNPFKCAVKAFLLEHCFYSINSYCNSLQHIPR